MTCQAGEAEGGAMATISPTVTVTIVPDCSSGFIKTSGMGRTSISVGVWLTLVVEMTSGVGEALTISCAPQDERKGMANIKHSMN